MMRSLKNHNLPGRRGYDGVELVPVDPHRCLVWWETSRSAARLVVWSEHERYEVDVDNELGHVFIDFHEEGPIASASLTTLEGETVARSHARQLPRPGRADHRLRWRRVLDPDEDTAPVSTRLMEEHDPVLTQPIPVPRRADVSSSRTAAPHGEDSGA